MNKKYNIGQFCFDKQQAIVSFEQIKVKLEPLPMAFLCFLIERQGQVVTKDQLLISVWQNRQVTDDSIRRVVKKLRDAFNDDARSPKYIKTVSMQGYQLIAAVSEINQTTDVINIKQQGLSAPSRITKFFVFDNKKRLLGMGLIFLSMLVVLIMLLNSNWVIKSTTTNANVSSETKLEQSQLAKPRIKTLTHLSGSELNGDFNKQQNLLIFSHRGNNNEAWHLYSKNLTTKVVQRLTWDQASYPMAFFSPDGKQIALFRQHSIGSQIWLADFDANAGLSNLVALTQPKQNHADYPLSWSFDGKHIYVQVSNTVTYSIFSLAVATKQWQQITFSQSQNDGDYAAKGSPDGKHLAVISNVSDRSYAITIFNLHSQTLVVRKSLSFAASSILWQADSQSLMLSSFKGDLYHYDINSDLLTEQVNSRPGLNDIFYLCARNCVYMRSHQMDYTDISEIPNPFTDRAYLASLHIESTNAEFSPIYNHGGDTLFYTNKGQYQAHLVSHKRNAAPEQLLSFNPRHILRDLSLSPDQTHLLGKLENRIFVLNLLSKEMKYITSALEDVYFPHWQTNQAIYFTRQQQNNKRLFSYDLSRDKLERQQDDYIIRRHLSDGRKFVVDKDHNLYQLMANSAQRFITRLPYIDSATWQINQEFVYYSQRIKDEVVLTRQHLKTAVKQTRVLGQNVAKTFSIHPDGSRLLLTKNLLADSNLVEVHW
jgi:transcriptional activator of cad operon